MIDSYVCKNCGTTLNVDPQETATNRKPCPECGSTKRIYSVSCTGHLHFSGSATLSTVEKVFSLNNLLLQAVVIPGDKTTEGDLIVTVTESWFDIIEFLIKNPDDIHQINYRKWEEIIAGAYKRAGFDEVTITPRSGDFGRDIIAIKSGIGEVRIIDQVKAYKPGHLVTANDVRALMGVLDGDGASKGFVTTTSDFAPMIETDPLIQPFIPNRLELINGEMLLQRLAEISKR